VNTPPTTPTGETVEMALTVPPALVEAIAARAAEIVLTHQSIETAAKPESPYMTIPEAAALLRCSRQRVDNLLSARRLTRVKDGRRTLVLRSEIEQHLVRHPRRDIHEQVAIR